MKILALFGAENSGKSHTVNIIYQLFLQDKWKQVPGYFEELGNKKYEDILDVLEKDGKRIGIIGAGDFQTHVKAYLTRIDKVCDVIICSCRDDGKVEKAFKAYGEPEKINKTISNDRSQYRIINSNDATKVYNTVYEMF